MASLVLPFAKVRICKKNSAGEQNRKRLRQESDEQTDELVFQPRRKKIKGGRRYALIEDLFGDRICRHSLLFYLLQLVGSGFYGDRVVARFFFRIDFPLERKICFCTAGHNGQHADAFGSEFRLERGAKCVQRRFGRGIIAIVGDGRDAADRTYHTGRSAAMS